ncbi:MAG: molybdopterin-dependent oxidoreductase [Acidobacteriota bacterium]
MLVRSARPEDLEMPVEGFQDYITPIDRFFVRTHVTVPMIDVSRWRLRVEGEVSTALTLTLDAVKQLPTVELVSVAECAGNGRRFFEPPVPGVQWGNGAVGNGRWRGVRLAEILKHAGIKDSAREILFDGADVPFRAMPDFQRSIPVRKALDPNTLLAYEMNGETLPLKHGFPLRAVVPGWAGDSWVKWLTSVRVLDKEHDGFWMKSAYRHPGTPVAPGAAVPLERMQPVTSLRLKSVIAAPVDGAQAAPGKRLPIWGVSWSGDAGPVTAVDVSVDGGRRWRPAKLRRGQRSRFGWRQWEFDWTPPEPAFYTILARARDAAGNTQPLDQEWNPSGYSWNVVPRVRVDVGGEVAAARGLTESRGSDITRPDTFRNACLACHDEDIIGQQRLGRAQWDREIQKMVNWGARVTDDERARVLEYLANQYGARLR